jgi:hypothetical protein
MATKGKPTHSHQHPHDHGHDEGHDHDHTHDHDAMDECLEACLQCHVVCTMTAQYCLAEAGVHSDVNQIGILLDCAQICQTSADFMTRGSPYHTVTCAACAEICRACAESCRSFEGDEHMTHCAETCERCAEHCEAMAQSDAGDEEGEEQEDEES